MTRRTLVFLVLAAVVLAGCSTAPGTGTTATPTNGSDSGPAETQNSPSDVSSDQVPGVSDGALTNATALSRSNEEALADAGGEVRIRRTDGDRVTTYDVVVGQGFDTYALSLAREGDGTTGTLWSNETTRVTRLESGDGTRYRTAERQHDRLTVLTTVEDFLAAGNFTVANESTGNGTVVLTTDEVAPAGVDRGPLSGLGSFEGRLVVDASGRIHDIDVSGTLQDTTITYRYELRRTGIDRVTRPAWVEEVPASASLHPDIRIDVVNDSYLEIRNDGGDPVPRNATLEVTSNGTTGQATFASALEVGDRRYAYVAAADGGLELVDSPPESSAVSPVTSPISVSITTGDGVSLYSAGMAWGSESASEDGSGSGSGSESGSSSESSSGSSSAGGGSSSGPVSSG